MAKGTAKGALANMAGGAIGGGFVTIVGAIGLTPPGWVVVIVSLLGGGAVLGILNSVDSAINSKWEKRIFNLK